MKVSPFFSTKRPNCVLNFFPTTYGGEEGGFSSRPQPERPPSLPTAINRGLKVGENGLLDPLFLSPPVLLLTVPSWGQFHKKDKLVYNF